MNKLTYTSFLAVLCLFFTQQISAQAPGFMGKKATLSVNSASSIATFGPTKNNRGVDKFDSLEDDIGLNHRVDIDFSYVLARYSSVTLTLGRLATGVSTSAYTKVAVPEFYEESARDYHELFYRLKVNSVGILYNRFKPSKGSLAPMGQTFSFGLRRLFITGDLIEQNTKYHGNDGFEHRPLNIQSDFALNFATCAWTYTHIVRNRFLLNLGFQVSVPVDFGRYSNFTRISILENEGRENYTDLYEAQVFGRLLAHEFYALKIGAGVLLF